jgi:hypothetical protein
MVTLGVVDPQDVVEQKIVAIRRRQAMVGMPWRADHHLAKLPDLGMNAEWSVARWGFVCHDLILFKV